MRPFLPSGPLEKDVTNGGTLWICLVYRNWFPKGRMIFSLARVKNRQKPTEMVSGNHFEGMCLIFGYTFHWLHLERFPHRSVPYKPREILLWMQDFVLLPNHDFFLPFVESVGYTILRKPTQSHNIDFPQITVYKFLFTELHRRASMFGCISQDHSLESQPPLYSWPDQVMQQYGRMPSDWVVSAVHLLNLHAHGYIYIYLYGSIFIFIYGYIYIYICMDTGIYIYIWILVYIYIWMYIYLYGYK